MDKGRGLQYFIAGAVSLATATLGMSSAWTTPVMPKLLNNETDIDINHNQISWMLSLSPIGFMCGSLVTRFLCDTIGRRRSILASAVPMICGTIIAATAKKAWLLFIMKFLWGFSTGMVSTIVTIYIAEIADKEIRGRLVVSTRFMFNFGSLVVMCIGSFLSYAALNYCLLSMPILYFSFCIWIPESPYYYLKEGKVECARKELIRLRGSTDGLEADLERLSAQVKKEMSHASSSWELFRGRQYRKAIIIVVGLKLTQIMTGTQAVIQYLGVIMHESKAGIPLYLLLIIFGAIKFSVGIMSSMLADRVGRRPLLIYSFFGSSVSLAIVGTYFFLLEVLSINNTSLQPYGFITFAGIVSSSVISTFGFNSIIGVIQGEVFPMNVKAVAITSLNIYGGILGFTVTKLFQKIKDATGLCGVFWFFSSVALLGSIFSFFIIPETKGKSLREIQVMLQGDVYDATGEELRDIKRKEVERNEER
ncbi:facilitated trehalose transporter Tret1-like [Leptidea sinapis]|uniref:facilitated trehalose transporter Tret1-like n=1 Tax=Leptidea sinapis TaxID=189913 RepID=UPI00212EBF72|nr:facilitated trehalose transporter Tret1-like [Leptidea sinapis]XP_050670796.1 facilitated trehalose transporter Tret1-like [Leptidea sinapis]